MTTIHFYFDFLSPYAYFAHHRLIRLAQDHDARIIHHPIDLAAAKLAAGNDGPTTRSIASKFRYVQQDFERWTALYGIDCIIPASANSRALNIGMFLAEDAGKAQDYVAAAFRRTWSVGGDPDDVEMQRALCVEIGLDWAAFLSFLTSHEGAARYQAELSAAVSKGVFGVPTMMIGDEMWWGNDRLFMVEQYLRERVQVSPAAATGE